MITRVPEGCHVRSGMRVTVPFGRGNRISEGIVLSLEDKPAMESCKDILAVLDEQPVLDDFMLRAGGLCAGAVFLHLL